MTAKATRTLALVMSLLLMASIAVPGAVAQSDTSGEPSLGVFQNDSGEVTVTVWNNSTRVENASVNVSTLDENRSYEGSGTHYTNDNGTVHLPAPDHPVNISVVASFDNKTVETTKALEAADLAVDYTQDGDGTVLIDVLFGSEAASGADVTVEGDYEYAGTKTTDENGTVEFPPPTNDTTVNITADYQNHSKTIHATLEARNDSNPNNDFAQALVAFIHSLDIETMEGPPGQMISDFVHEHNPSNADNNAGPPEHAGPKNETLNATQENATDEQGPPPWAGPPGNETDTAENDSDERGPPENPGNGNGNGK